jgi:hypothetical protein
MDNHKYIKVDDNKVINVEYIKWIKKMDECLTICTRSVGCTKDQTHKLCKISNYNSYFIFNKLFEEYK